MRISYRRPVSLLDAAARRVRLAGFAPGAQLVPLGEPLDIVGFWHRGDELTAYVAGTMPAAMRSAAEAGRTAEETWLAPMPAGLHEIDLTDCRAAYLVRQPGPRLHPAAALAA